jgi:hypothetical protein
MLAMTAVDRRPTRRRGWFLAASLALILGVIVAGLAFAVTVDALRQGPVSGPDPVGLLASIEDVDGVVLQRYRYEPGASFLTLASVHNEGPLAITLLGLVEPSADVADTALMWPEALLLLPDDPGVVGPEESAQFAPVAIEPGRYRAVWIQWRVGDRCVPGQVPPYPPESGVGLGPLLPFRWSLFGIPRTTGVDLGYKVEAFNSPDDPLTVCPG